MNNIGNIWSKEVFAVHAEAKLISQEAGAKLSFISCGYCKTFQAERIWQTAFEMFLCKHITNKLSAQDWWMMGWFVACRAWRKTKEIQLPVPRTADVFLRVRQCILPKEPSGGSNPVRMSLFSNVPSEDSYIYDIFCFVKFYSDANAG